MAGKDQMSRNTLTNQHKSAIISRHVKNIKKVDIEKLEEYIQDNYSERKSKKSVNTQGSANLMGNIKIPK